ncbi:Actin-42A-like Protein [Tribolium castaneum]|uniref:Actin-42A-like Protein n=1 Tax=Tribolium castaneum TaxID=7070 RepID=D6WVY5_TRICA|nr:Actin-42A-like Protein [Tribolium castaneum]
MPHPSFSQLKKSGYKQLKVAPENHPVLLTKPYFPISKATTEKIAQIMFEDFKIPALHLIYPSVLSLYSYGSLTGLVVQSGNFESQFYPIYEGHILERTLTRGLPVAGQYLTEFLQDALAKKGLRCDYATANSIKERAFYVSMDLNNEQVNEEEFLLPDGSKITLGNEKYLIPEELYKSSIEYSPLHEFIFHALGRSDPELRPLLASKLVLAGGTTLLPGFGERLERELVNGAPQFKFMSGRTPRVVSQANRGDSAWLGGAILGQLATFPNMCMSRDEYEEYGPSLVHTKIF